MCFHTYQSWQSMNRRDKTTQPQHNVFIILSLKWPTNYQSYTYGKAIYLHISNYFILKMTYLNVSSSLRHGNICSYAVHTKEKPEQNNYCTIWYLQYLILISQRSSVYSKNQQKAGWRKDFKASTFHTSSIWRELGWLVLCSLSQELLLAMMVKSKCNFKLTMQNRVQ